MSELEDALKEVVELNRVLDLYRDTLDNKESRLYVHILRQWSADKAEKFAEDLMGDSYYEMKKNYPKYLDVIRALGVTDKELKEILKDDT